VSGDDCGKGDDRDGERLRAAIEIAREAGDLLLRYFGSRELGAREKGPRDIVTEADTASETLVRTRLQDRFARDGIVGEEGTAISPEHDGQWLVDPLDGTLNFARSIPMWCVSIAFFRGDQPVVGVVHDPIRAETFAAAAGGGAFVNGEPLNTSELSDASQAVVQVTVDFSDANMILGLHDLNAIAPRVLRTRNYGSAALTLAYLAAGRIDVMAHRLANAWDYGAGALLVREAGGIITELEGGPYSVHTRAILAACTPEVHKQILHIIPQRLDE
jgi:myo-inositol-1(or 4)-monophosphatase